MYVEFSIKKRKIKYIFRMTRPNIPIRFLTNSPPFPTTIAIDPTNICNLKCPLCPTGLKKMNYKQRVLSIVDFKLLLDKIPSLKHTYLYNWGESFLNPNIFKMIAYIKRNNTTVQIDTNFSFKKKEDFFVNIVESGLDILRISLDGASQESYSKYKIGGNFDTIISNIKKLVSIKNKLHAEKPVVIWKFIVTRFNENEIEKAKKWRPAWA